MKNLFTALLFIVAFVATAFTSNAQELDTIEITFEASDHAPSMVDIQELLNETRDADIVHIEGFSNSIPNRNGTPNLTLAGNRARAVARVVGFTGRIVANVVRGNDRSQQRAIVVIRRHNSQSFSERPQTGVSENEHGICDFKFYRDVVTLTASQIEFVADSLPTVLNVSPKSLGEHSDVEFPISVQWLRNADTTELVVLNCDSSKSVKYVVGDDPRHARRLARVASTRFHRTGDTRFLGLKNKFLLAAKQIHKHNKQQHLYKNHKPSFGGGISGSMRKTSGTGSGFQKTVMKVFPYFYCSK